MITTHRLVRRAAVVVALALGSTAIATAVSATTATVPWQPEDANLNVGTLTFYNASGQVITSGSINDAPFAAYARGSAAGRAGDTKATLFGYTPKAGVQPNGWQGEQLTSSSSYPNTAAPAGLNSGSLPLVSLTASSTTLATFIGDYPNTDTSTTDGYGGVYELRLKTSAPGVGVNTVWESADIQVSGSTWTQVYPVASVSSTTVATIPASTIYGRAFTIPTKVSSTHSVSGVVTARVGSTVLASATLGAATNAGGVYTAAATIVVPGTKLAPGSHTITVSYAGASPVLGSAAAPKIVTTAKAPSTTVEKLSALTISHLYHAKVTVTVSAVGVVPTGAVAIYNGTQRLALVSLPYAYRGRITITLPLLRAGYYHLTARYYGSTTVAASVSRSTTLHSV